MPTILIILLSFHATSVKINFSVLFRTIAVVWPCFAFLLKEPFRDKNNIVWLQDNIFLCASFASDIAHVDIKGL